MVAPARDMHARPPFGPLSHRKTSVNLLSGLGYANYARFQTRDSNLTTRLFPLLPLSFSLFFSFLSALDQQSSSKSCLDNQCLSESTEMTPFLTAPLACDENLVRRSNLLEKEIKAGNANSSQISSKRRLSFFGGPIARIFFSIPPCTKRLCFSVATCGKSGSSGGVCALQDREQPGQ